MQAFATSASPGTFLQKIVLASSISTTAPSVLSNNLQENSSLKPKACTFYRHSVWCICFICIGHKKRQHSLLKGGGRQLACGMVMMLILQRRKQSKLQLHHLFAINSNTYLIQEPPHLSALSPLIWHLWARDFYLTPSSVLTSITPKFNTKTGSNSISFSCITICPLVTESSPTQPLSF